MSDHAAKLATIRAKAHELMMLLEGFDGDLNAFGDNPNFYEQQGKLRLARTGAIEARVWLDMFDLTKLEES